ncbi:hypothetical protein PTSG_04908 [Salpingoeca rosetta]|uniref:Uncharacterized protein n=1 Tax=Salpingoeca rosetta (strain ATCC 50818 / BSB-021) TaxID=946362 RepID=F2U8Z1_SALR5|nr:uncharacterized protein PTSG_04908 [Salpingoeca rosetta]EGD73194.1 hypothetical protein PTSG_04908 [Salpingoeca rosetta]|eukprot:XP_004994225.1 hypothetical protein PTSG_04908 [Salpingoeca rosetta]
MMARQQRRGAPTTAVLHVPLRLHDLSSHARSECVKGFIKTLLFQRRQIPCVYEQLKQQADELSAEETGPLRLRAKTKQFVAYVQALESLFDTLDRAVESADAAVILLGSTRVTPSEAYWIDLPHQDDPAQTSTCKQGAQPQKREDPARLSHTAPTQAMQQQVEAAPHTLHAARSSHACGAKQPAQPSSQQQQGPHMRRFVLAPPPPPPSSSGRSAPSAPSAQARRRGAMGAAVRRFLLALYAAPPEAFHMGSSAVKRTGLHVLLRTRAQPRKGSSGGAGTRDVDCDSERGCVPAGMTACSARLDVQRLFERCRRRTILRWDDDDGGGDGDESEGRDGGQNEGDDENERRDGNDGEGGHTRADGNDSARSRNDGGHGAGAMVWLACAHAPKPVHPPAVREQRTAATGSGTSTDWMM